MKYGTLKFSILFVLMTAAFLQAAEPEQLAAPRNVNNSMQYGLPGWVEIDSRYSGSSVVPSSGAYRIDLATGFSVSRGSSSYHSLSVGSDGRVILGAFDEGASLPPSGSGSRPHVIPTQSTLQPIPGSSSIPVKWYFNNNYEGIYTVVQVGPLSVEGSDKTYSYQVLAYTDGELQFFWWLHENTPLEERTPLGSGLAVELNLLGRSGFYNGSAVEWSVPSMTFLFNVAFSPISRRENLIFNGSLRNGWIAKSFDNNGVVFSAIAGSHHDIRFGTANTPGGLFAYDYSREHPVVGAIDFLIVSPKQSNSGSSIAFWYFSETIAKTSDADYPTVDPFGVNTSVSASCLAKMTSSNMYLPCMYAPSWNAARAKGINPDWISAPAVKFQSLGSGTDRQLDIQSITYSLRQPRSVQFLPPKSYELDLRMGAGGYALVEDKPRSNPYQIFADRAVDARIVAKPGQTIQRISINGMEIYNGTHFASPTVHDPIYDLLEKVPGSEEIRINGILKKDYLVEAEFSQCSGRDLALPASPAYIHTETFLDAPGNSQRKMEVYAVKDGFGRTVQSQQRLGVGSFSVQGTYLDALGRTRYAPLSFVHPSSGYNYVDMACLQCVTLADAWHDGSDPVDRPDDMGVPFAESVYHGGEGNGALKSSAGLAGASFALSDSWSKEWAIPVSSAESFIAFGELSDESIQGIYRNRLEQAQKQGGLNYVLRIVRDREGRYQQSIQDGAGNVLSTRIHDGNDVLSTIQEYDALDRPVKHYPAGRSFAGLASTQEMDGAGRIRSVTGPDRGKTESRYDQYGRLRFVRSARQLARGAGHFSVHEYDSQGRLVRTGEVQGGHSFESPDSPLAAGILRPVTETVYGSIHESRLSGLGLALDAALLAEIAGQNVHPSDIGAIIAYDEEGNAASLKAWSYDRLGNKESHWIVYGIGSPPVRLQYTYNASGELVLSFFSEWSGTEWVDRSVRGREYDSRGQLTRVLEDGETVAAYERSERGRLRSKTLYDRGVPVLTRRTEKDISGRPLSLSHMQGNELLYKETAAYTGNSGRLEQAIHRWQIGSQETVHSTGYTYDDLGRLRSATGDLGGYYNFDNVGRLTYKVEDNRSIALMMGHFLPHYAIQSTGGRVFFHYDASGHLYREDNPQTTYRIGDRGLPVDIRGYENLAIMPSIEQVESGEEFSGEVYRAEMVYGEDNQRLWRKLTNPATGNSRIEVTIPGVGSYVKENDGAWRLSRLELVEGGYRTDGTGAALFAVTDVQGNVRGYAKRDGGLASAYGYYPYGMVHELKEDNTADRSRWQGKEWDGEYGKYYFGSRYFDPYFGLWISPDPAGQFSNPYTYGGDPVNFVDPDGEFVLPLIASVAQQVYQKGWKPNRWDWGHIGNSVGTGMFVTATGGPVGAAGLVTTASTITRLGYSDDPGGVFTDAITGGLFVDNVGHMIGLTNVTLTGGTADWYQGNVVYSKGAASAIMPDNSGAAWTGHAIFVQNRNKKSVIAHEIRHAQQVEKRGNRFRYMVSYMSENGWSLSPDTPEYEDNPYENDARYAQYLYETKRTNIYGKKRGNWTHEGVADGFRKWMVRNEYYSFQPSGANRNWQWKEQWEHGNDF